MVLGHREEQKERFRTTIHLLRLPWKSFSLTNQWSLRWWNQSFNMCKLLRRASLKNGTCNFFLRLGVRCMALFHTKKSAFLCLCWCGTWCSSRNPPAWHRLKLWLLSKSKMRSLYQSYRSRISSKTHNREHFRSNRKTKIKSKMTSFREKHVLRFDVPMSNPSLVEEVNTLEQLWEVLVGEGGGTNSLGRNWRYYKVVDERNRPKFIYSSLL